MAPKMVMHPIKPELDGKDLSGMKDPAGNALFMGFVDVVNKQGAGFYSYLWPKPGFEQPVGKISYVKGFAPWGWIIGTGIYLDDVDAVFRQNATTFAYICLAVLVLVLACSFVIGRSVTRPLANITALTERLAAGDSAFEVPYTGRSDEVGGLAKALAVFKDNASAVSRMHAEQQETKQRADDEKRKTMADLAGKFEASVQAVVRDVFTEARAMQQAAQGMSETANKATDRASFVATACQQASSNVQTVASAAGQLSSSITEISQRVAQAANVADKAAADGQRTNDTVQGLAVAAHKIGEVIDLINQIASQDQPARAQRHHRSGARRRGRQGICRGRERGEIAGEPDREGDRRDRRADHRDPGRDQPGCRQHREHPQDHHGGQRDLLVDRRRCRGAGRRDAGDRPQRAGGGVRHRPGLAEHLRCHRRHGGNGPGRGPRAAIERPAVAEAAITGERGQHLRCGRAGGLTSRSYYLP
ncbi:HAMP domain-containing protein/uncharacterized protein YoxC [Bradyrhizobium sp. i1.3.1]